MKLTIESTGLTPVVNGVPVRLWKGTTEQGKPCVVMVHMIAGDREAQEELDAALDHVRAPWEPALDHVAPAVARYCQELSLADATRLARFDELDRIRLLQAAGLIASGHGLVEVAELCLAEAAGRAYVAYGPGPGRDG